MAVAAGGDSMDVPSPITCVADSASGTPSRGPSVAGLLLEAPVDGVLGRNGVGAERSTSAFLFDEARKPPVLIVRFADREVLDS
ncbi:hypothetical protein ORI20_21030 [Mycobacterium sp. CVI_P3]|uniref:Uncharacterized protein n=1 Tax=Mycobacterium pinniadriaticum TaxID=2994102 RepID=A0ABT3SI41_9MYCO|nr:hypothetical protein [Mycobacterium pinniadriaticum]MCX2932761.1 hypothetical protein [Mycobacterium pinniadriaticum]MCX2939179.1 hypothetical protein [Mycobacterium pinniadriaticum]